MDCALGRQVWKGTLVWGVLTIVLGAMVLVWPGPTILVAATMLGVYLLISRLAELFLAFTLSQSAATRVMLFFTGALSLVLALLSFVNLVFEHAVLPLMVLIRMSSFLVVFPEKWVKLIKQCLKGRCR